MKIISSPQSFQRWRRSLPKNQSVGFVPTMGALHHGHLSLVARAKKENDVVVASVFVNPKQFGPREDFSRYPRPFLRDRQLLEQAKVEILLAPSPNSMYPSGYATSVSVANLTNTLCGDPRSRGPEHFIGVATVVAKLFNIVLPTRAYFGLKDFQQVRVIEQMVEDLNFDIKVVRCATVRERDGLAVSSRNAYLSPAERAEAPRLYRALQQGRKLLTSSPKMNLRMLLRKISEALLGIPNSKIDYIELVDPRTLTRLTTPQRPALLAAAMWLGRTRLIDNILIG